MKGSVLIYVLSGLGALILIYLIARLTSRGIFQSYFETKNLYEKGELNGKENGRKKENE